MLFSYCKITSLQPKQQDFSYVHTTIVLKSYRLLCDNHTFPSINFVKTRKMINFAPDMKYGTILIVDDNTSILTALKICLADVFEKIITLANPDGLLAKLQQERVDVILLDMNFTMGMNNGQEGLTWLRTIHRLHA